MHNGRLLYPYSVVPGGVHDTNELRDAIQRDRAVARHYAAFNLHKARIVELKSPRLVFLSYRLGDKIFWTRKQIKLKEGERLITDGNISARTRCANQVSVLPQTAVSTEEPLPEQLEDPFGVGGSSRQIDFPNSLESSLFRRTPPGLGEGPGFFGPPFGGGGPGIAPPPIPTSCAKPPCSNTPPPPPPPPPPPSRVRCVVPRVIGLRLAAARTRIRRAHCRVGRVRRARSRLVGRVIAQRPRPGVRRAAGTPVNLVVGRR
jgi:hypothetical protein